MRPTEHVQRLPLAMSRFVSLNRLLLERHFKTPHESYGRDLPAQTPLHATKIRDLKTQLAAPSTAVNLHQNPELGRNYSFISRLSRRL